MSLSKIFPIQNNLEDGKTIIITNPSTTVDWWLRDAGEKGSFATLHVNLLSEVAVLAERRQRSVGSALSTRSPDPPSCHH